jgi:hypothetical protein
MPIELTCSCGKRLQVSDAFAGRQGQCPACGELLQIPEPEAQVTRPAPSSDGAARAVSAAPEPAGPKGPGAPEDGGSAAVWHETERRNPEKVGDVQLTGIGCVFTSLSVVIIVAVALPVLRWRDPETGRPLPRMVAIVAPILIGASFLGICALLLQLFGLRLWTRSEKDDAASPRGGDRFPPT